MLSLTVVYTYYCCLCHVFIISEFEVLFFITSNQQTNRQNYLIIRHYVDDEGSWSHHCLWYYRCWHICWLQKVQWVVHPLSRPCYALLSRIVREKLCAEAIIVHVRGQPSLLISKEQEYSDCTGNRSDGTNFTDVMTEVSWARSHAKVWERAPTRAS